MITVNEKNWAKARNKGFTLVELAAVIAIVAVLAAATVPSYISYVESTKEKMCNINSLQLVRTYHAYLTLKNTDHSEALFVQYLKEYGQEICPQDGDISYADGKVRCSIHDTGDGEDEDEDGDVPYL